MWHKIILKRSLTGLNLEFSFSQISCLTKIKEPGLSYYLLIAEGRIFGFIYFSRVLALCKMLTASSNTTAWLQTLRDDQNMLGITDEIRTNSSATLSYRLQRIITLCNLQKLFKNTGCCPEDLPRMMANRDNLQERVKGICAAGTPW